MKLQLSHDTYGELVYDENFWTGKRRITVGGKELTKSKRNTYVYKDLNTSITVVLKGSLLFGLTAKINDEAEQVLALPPKWYEFVIVACIFSIGIILGNFPVHLAFPVVGGAVGGGISGVMAVLALLLMKPVKKVNLKILIGIGVLALNFFVCHVVALLFLAALA